MCFLVRRITYFTGKLALNIKIKLNWFKLFVLKGFVISTFMVNFKVALNGALYK